jgi:CheY-like chemotaxis protein
MTTEQNQPQAQPPQGQAPQGQPQGHRRRRRKRKGAKGQPNGPQVSGQAGQQNQQQQGQKPRHPGQNRHFQKNGSNNNGQGGRRKNKPRKQQVFVGPMDHSYRVANGNIADGPPSTIEYRGVNGNGNGFHHVETTVEPATPPREDAPTRIFCFIDDLFFLAKIQETARKLGVKVGFVKADKDIVAKLADVPDDAKPSLIVFDLNNANAKPLTLIPRIKSKLKRGTSVIGFLSHLQGDLKVKALEAGCDMVMPRSAFSQNLPNLLRRHGLDEELEAMEA